MKVRYWWSEDGISEFCAYERVVLEQPTRCYHCAALIETKSECVKLTAPDNDIYWLHPLCAKKGIG